MKKAISLFLALVLILAVFAGCAGEPEEPETSSTPPATPTAAEGADAPAGARANDFGEIDPGITATTIQEVVYIQGSWYDMGRQYARRQGDLIERVYMTAISKTLAEIGLERAYEIVNIYMDGYKETEPDLYNFVQGVADELEISLEDAAIGTFCDRINLAGFEDEGEPAQTDACMHASVWGEMSRDGHLMGACNLDEGIGALAQYASSLITIPDGGYAVAAGAGLLSNAVLNSNGVMILYSGQKGGSGDLLKYDYLNSVAFLWYVAAKAGTADEAVAMLTAHDLYKDGNICVTDVNGGASMLENATMKSVIRKSGELGETDYLIAANHFTSPELADWAYPDGVFLDSIPRVDTVERILLDNAGQVDEGVLARALGSREYYMDGQWSGENWELGEFQYHSPEMCDFVDKTITRTIIDATDLELHLLRGHYDYYTSHVPYTTAQFTKLTLAGSAAEVNKSADFDARLMLWYASYDLDHAAEKDPVKDEYLQMGNQKVQEGLNYTLMAQYAQAMGEGDKALEYYGLATSAFCRAQQFGQAAQIENNTFVK